MAAAAAAEAQDVAQAQALAQALIDENNLKLFAAAKIPDVFQMAEAMAQGASVNFVNEGAGLRTPVFETVALGSLEATEFLLLNGAKVNVQDGQAMTPLHVACEHGFTA